MIDAKVLWIENDLEEIGYQESPEGPIKQATWAYTSEKPDTFKVIRYTEYEKLELENLELKRSLAIRSDYESILAVVRQWKLFWMNQNQNGPQDHSNYFQRAYGIDSNMVHSLAEKFQRFTKGDT